MQKQLKLSDDVLRRVLQLFQEAMLLGIDCTDLLRQISLVVSDDDVLELSPEYAEVVKKQQDTWVTSAQAQVALREAGLEIDD
jgi:hypothetical protein